MKRSHVITSVMTALLLWAFPGMAQEPLQSLSAGQAGKVTFLAKTPKSYSGLARGQVVSEPITGELVLPNAEGRVPAIVMAHGSSGISDRDQDWAKLLRDQGWATFMVDSFATRGITATQTNQGQLSYAVGVADSLSALELLATHPRIDPKRIAVMGFSRGGSAALYGVHEAFRKGVIKSDLRFAAHVAVYPGCLVMTDKQTGAPVRIYMGDKDDYQTPQTCERFTKYLVNQGTDAKLTVYKDAKHGFDDTVHRHTSNAKAEQWSACGHMYFVEKNTFWRPDTGETRPVSEISSFEAGCKRLGAAFGRNSDARAAARQDIVEFLKAHLSP